MVKKLKLFDLNGEQPIVLMREARRCGSVLTSTMPKSSAIAYGNIAGSNRLEQLRIEN